MSARSTVTDLPSLILCQMTSKRPTSSSLPSILQNCSYTPGDEFDAKDKLTVFIYSRCLSEDSYTFALLDNFDLYYTA